MVAAMTALEAQEWLIDNIAQRLGLQHTDISAESTFDELPLDHKEALLIIGDVEDWLGFELGTTALWYHPAIKNLANIAGEWSQRVVSG